MEIAAYLIVYGIFDVLLFKTGDAVLWCVSGGRYKPIPWSDDGSKDRLGGRYLASVAVGLATWVGLVVAIRFVFTLGSSA